MNTNNTFRIEKQKIKKIEIIILTTDQRILKVKKLIKDNSKSLYVQEIIKIRLEKLNKLQQKNKNTLKFLTEKINNIK